MDEYQQAKILIQRSLPLKKFLSVIFHSFLPAEKEKENWSQYTFCYRRLLKSTILFKDTEKYLRTKSETKKKHQKLTQIKMHEKKIQLQNIVLP